MHGQAVFRSTQNLLSKGFRPDVVIGHAGWGETLFVKDALPDTPVLSFFEVPEEKAVEVVAVIGAAGALPA